jgi:pimeloyl-ACP methyl ester carboxylesterase
MLRSYHQRKRLKQINSKLKPNGISSVEAVQLGGIQQHIVIQAGDVTNPILLFLHGGPGMPDPGVAYRGLEYTIATRVDGLIKNFVVVYWDQRGTGKSYNSDIPPETMNLNQFYSDSNELVDYLREILVKRKYIS